MCVKKYCKSNLRSVCLLQIQKYVKLKYKVGDKLAEKLTQNRIRNK